MDQDNEPQSITLAEWNEWSTAELAKPITEEMQKSLEADDAAAAGGGGAAEGDEDDDDDDGGFSKEEEVMLEAAIKKFGETHGRAPTEIEVGSHECRVTGGVM